MLISVSGLIGAGKDTVGNYLINEKGFVKRSFSAALKDVVAAVFHWPRDLLEGDTIQGREWRDTVDTWWDAKLRSKFNTPITPRFILQYVGTEVMRNHLDSNIWVYSIERRLELDKDANIIITDARFLNELQLVKQNNGHLIRLVRGDDIRTDFINHFKPYTERAINDYTKILTKEEILEIEVSVVRSLIASSPYANLHESEWQHLLFRDYTSVIFNDSNIERLETKIQHWLS